MPVWEIETPDGGLIQVEGDEEPTEDQIASFFTPEEPIQQPTIPRLQPGATLADVLRQPPLVTPPWEGGVVRSVLPGVLQPEDLLPAVRKIGGSIAEGEPGDTHPDIITREQIPAIEIDQRGFTGPEGQFLDRESAAQATGIPTMREPGRLHSTDLSAFQEQGGFEAQLEAAKDVPEPLIKLPEIPESIKEAYSAPVRAIFGDKAADVEVAAADALYKAAKSVPEFLTTEEGMLSLLASLIPAGRAGVTAFFTADQAKSVLDQAKEMGGKWDEMTAPQKAAAVTQAAASLGFTALMAKAGVGEIGRMVKPEVPSPPVIPEEAKPARSLTPAIRLPDGQIFTGPAHKDIFIKVARETGEPDLLAEASKPQNQGFVNEKGEFKSRSEASPIFKELTGKEPADAGSLKSEDFVGFEHLFDFGEKAKPTAPIAKEPWQMTKSEYDLTEPTGDRKRESFQAAIGPVKVRIIKNPLPEDYQRINLEHTMLYPNDRTGDPKTRFTIDSKGNRYVWPAADASHSGIESWLKETKGIIANQNTQWFSHGYHVRRALFARKQVPPEVLADYPELAKPAAPSAKTPGKSIGAGIQVALMRKAEAGAIQIPQGVTDAVTKAADYVKEVASEEMNAPKMTDTRRSVLNWSAKLQKSFNEASLKQRDITRRVPKPIRREGITNWIQANGDPSVLRQRAAATTDPKLKRGYEAALNLTPDEIAVANEVKQAYADFASRGQAADVLGQLKENYVTQTWNLGKGPSGGAVGRTLKEKFRYSKASTFANFFEGEQAGYKPKTKDISKLLPMYSHEMNSVIAAREMVAQMAEGKASDGRPLLAPKGIGVPVDSGEGGKATLVMPKVGKEATADYKVLPNQPALSGWKWVSKDEAGNPIFLKADLALHPEAFDKLKNVLGRSAIRDWYGTRTTALAEIPKMLVKGIDMANSETKRTMLGLLATFHQIQTGTHAVGHRVNPLFSIPKIDLANNPLQMDAAKHGLMLAPDRASMSQFMEGFRTSGIISKIPVIGPAADWYGHYLFHDYIPGLKFKTYDAILRRNRGVYAKDLSAGKVSLEDVKILSAEQANAAYGHINYSDLSRNPTVQHVAQLGLLAPDFLEARGRFAGQAIKGIAGAKVGREQLLALATLAVAQTAGAYAISKIVDGEWDSKRPFEFTKGNRRYTLRSVPEDIQNLVTKTRQFVHNRISPLVGKGLLQYLTGIDYRGQRVKASETTKELLAQPLPLTIRGFTGLSKSTLSSMEQLAGSLGLRISRYSPQMDLADIVRDYKKGSDDPKLQAQIELQEKEVFASVYDKLRTALHSNDLEQARKEYDKLNSIRTPKQIDNAMKPWTGGTVNRETLEVSPRKPKPFTGSLATEKKFVQSLTQDQRDIYNRAQEERIKFYRTFRDMLRQTGQ